MFEQYTNIYFIGIGGIGMSALARYFLNKGKHVEGYDAVESEITKELTTLGIKIHYKDDLQLVSEQFLENKAETLVVYTPAIPSEHQELNYFRTNNFKVLKRAEVLGLISQTKKTIAVAGTHGKTTVSAILATILDKTSKLNSAFVGGIVKNYHSNYIFDDQNSRGWIVAEADEYDKSFLQLNPFASIITAVEPDHLDIYGDKEQLVRTFEEFAVKNDNFLIVNENIYLDIPERRILTYGFSDDSNFVAKNIRFVDGVTFFDFSYPDGLVKDIKLHLPGEVNVLNATAALAMSYLVGVEPKMAACAVECFEGIERRFDFIVNTSDKVFINDYAHHPTEIEWLYKAVRQLYNDKELTAVFQPHLFTRTRDFADDFASVLQKFDNIIVTDIYPAREKPIEGVTSKLIFDKINNPNKKYCEYNQVVELVGQMSPSVLLTIGAGDINNLVDDLKNVMLNDKA